MIPDTRAIRCIPPKMVISVKKVRRNHDSLMPGDKGYLSADVQQDLFETAHIRQKVPYRLNQKNYLKLIISEKNYRIPPKLKMLNLVE